MTVVELPDTAVNTDSSRFKKCGLNQGTFHFIMLRLCYVVPCSQGVTYPVKMLANSVLEVSFLVTGFVLLSHFCSPRPKIPPECISDRLPARRS